VGESFFNDKFKRLSEGKIPTNLQERLEDWRLFGSGIVESPKTALAGHPQPMPREIRSSPHNWYIDIAYTFGLLALIPMAVLIGHTAVLCWRQRKALDRESWCLVWVVFYLVAIDSNFKVTLRQPYPGIFAYFLWGLLLARLHALATRQPRFGDDPVGAQAANIAAPHTDEPPGGQQVASGGRQRLDTDPLHVSASLVIYKNELAMLGQTLQALQEAGRLAREKYSALRLSLVLVDNSESLGFHVKLGNWIRQFQAELPDWELKLLRAPANLGYGRGNNLAIRESHSNYHIVINPDLFVQDGTLLEGLNFMESHEEVGLLTPAVFGEDGQRHYLCKRNPSLMTMFLRSFSPKCLQGWLRHLNDQYEMRDLDYEKCIRRVEYPTGCFMFFRTEALKKIGGFDPDFFLHYEDADIGRRMLRVAEVVYVPDVRVVHRWARDTHRSLAAKLITVRSGFLYWRKWGGVF
jgi:GT2 family glycosyltransferase